MKTISVTGKSKNGFTLLEVLIVVALATIIATLAVFNVDTLVRAFSTKSPRAIFEDTLQEARLQALTLKQAVHLQLDKDAEKWTISSDKGEIVFISEVAYENEDERPFIYTYSPGVFERDAEARPSFNPQTKISFSSAGISTPFGVSYRGENGDPIPYDPLTAYPIITSE